uniref:Uncharacterized protein n=1 Tax=Eutreptiella gymnastica TaxID=73025 RepID=A0A6T1PB02_9EUGL
MGTGTKCVRRGSGVGLVGDGAGAAGPAPTRCTNGAMGHEGCAVAEVVVANGMMANRTPLWPSVRWTQSEGGRRKTIPRKAHVVHLKSSPSPSSGPGPAHPRGTRGGYRTTHGGHRPNSGADHERRQLTLAQNTYASTPPAPSDTTCTVFVVREYGQAQGPVLSTSTPSAAMGQGSLQASQGLAAATLWHTPPVVPALLHRCGAQAPPLREGRTYGQRSSGFSTCGGGRGSWHTPDT